MSLFKNPFCRAILRLSSLMIHSNLSCFFYFYLFLDKRNHVDVDQKKVNCMRDDPHARGDSYDSYIGRKGD